MHIGRGSGGSSGSKKSNDSNKSSGSSDSSGSSGTYVYIPRNYNNGNKENTQEKINEEMNKINYNKGSLLVNIFFLVTFVFVLIINIVILISIIKQKPTERKPLFLIGLIPGIILLIAFIVYSVNIKKIPDKTVDGYDMTDKKKEYNGMRWANGAISFGLLLTSIIIFIRGFYLVP